MIVDGKYIHVKGHEKKIPLIWGLDYLSHDVLVWQLSGSENFISYLAFFNSLKAIHYPLQTVVCDELESIILAAQTVYPKVHIQICTNHYKEGIRRLLRSRTTPEHEHFIKQIEFLFRKINMRGYSKYAKKLFLEHNNNPIYRNILMGINNKHKILTRYLTDKHIPSTSNLIELYNSHLEARLRSIKGFKSFYTAELWLNAYVLNRRLSKFTSCCKKFKKLNGVCSLSLTAKDNYPKIQFIKNAG